MNSEIILQKIMQLDEHITDLVKERSSLLSKIRTKGYIPAEMEKKLRQHWELYASERTKDTFFVRNLFKIIQQVEMQQTGDLSPGKFILTPSKSSVNFTLRGTCSSELAHLALLFSAVSNTPIALSNVAISDSIFATIKMLQALGVAITWEGSTVAIHSSNITMNDIVVHLGETEFALYCALALNISTVGHVKYVGGLSLSLLDLSAVKELLALCGVRITSLGGVSGIPARVESTMQMPDTLELTQDIPCLMALALCTVAPAWKKSCTIHFASHPDKYILAERMKELYTLLGIQHEYADYIFTFPATQENITTTPQMPLDPYHTFARLLVPYFTNGSATIEGLWLENSLCKAVGTQLEDFGLEVEITPTYIRATKKEAPKNITFTHLPLEYFPLVFCAFLSYARTLPSASMPTLPETLDISELQSFLEALCIEEHDGKIIFNKDFVQNSWIAPSAYWIIGYAYAAFLRPAITLANPSDVTAVLPNFWRFYNTFPIPIEYDQPALQEASTTTKRRLIVR